VLLQSLLVIATTVVLASTVLLSALVSAKTSLHQEATRKAETAAADGTTAFVAWAQSIMAKNALTNSNDWPTKPSAPIREELCVPGTLPPGVKCPFVATIDWTVTGKSATSDAPSVWSTSSHIANASATLDEQRISATLVTLVTRYGVSSPANVSAHTRKLTARTFSAYPYVVITAVHDDRAESASVATSEGDTGGEFDFGHQHVAAARLQTPDPLRPAAYINTSLMAEATCSEPSYPVRNGGGSIESAPDFKAVRTYGNADWRFEAPCRPKTRVTLNLPSPTWTPPDPNHYVNDASISNTWDKHDGNTNPFEY